MKLLPEYAQILIVGVMHEGRWGWYVTEREYWFLNIEMEERFGIEVLDETTAGKFLIHIEEYKASADELRQMLLDIEDACATMDDVLEFMPTIYVNFDERTFFSQFPEPMSFELYMPDGWTGSYADFYGLVPEAERFWIIDGASFYDKFAITRT
ncbi:hypothetical protein E2R60_12665 [Paenibacillus dendritiformis]|uniref:hypothetical protein n=1 Tax=Paenibacillus dendritiformis TaxID=130049 RepID=UPI00105A8E90|nr:hypothetical protein [Paenibacillus dendritiformis]TDL53883.1 hypothetical protein E2R60_12665 [Paenibacillus dendritiformis]